jgi:hypothetical protein
MVIQGGACTCSAECWERVLIDSCSKSLCEYYKAFSKEQFTVEQKLIKGFFNY